jgi:hypothetical protein
MIGTEGYVSSVEARPFRGIKAGATLMLTNYKELEIL